MEANTDLPALIAGATTLLKRKKFRPETLESYHRTWRQIADYMAAENQSEFTRDVGDAFIQARFGKRHYEDLNLRERSCIYYTMVLWYYGLNHSLPRSIRKRSDINFDSKLGSLFKEFLAFKALTCTPSTLRLYSYRLHPLYCDLVRAKQTLSEIDGTYIVRFLSRLDITQKPKEKDRMIEQTGMFLSYLCYNGLLIITNHNIGAPY